MGYFTYTYADRKLRRNKYGEYHASCKLQYDGHSKGYIAFPDGTFAGPETYYDGYGIIAGIEVYEQTAEWNRPYLEEILTAIQRKKGKFFVTDKLLAVGTAWQNDDQKTIDAICKKWEEEGRIFEAKEWKRNIGISIVCEGNNDMPEIRYPLKITAGTKISYKDLPPSIATQ